MHPDPHLARAGLGFRQIDHLKNFRTAELGKSDRFHRRAASLTEVLWFGSAMGTCAWNGSGAAAHAVHQRILRQSIFGAEVIEDLGIHWVRE
jgi:hypothetical protein